MMGLLFWHSVAAVCARTDQPADHEPTPSGRADDQAQGVVVGYVTVEYDADGHPHSDGRFYTDAADAADVVSRRNGAEGEPAEPLDQWWVLPVTARGPAAAAAAAAAHLRSRSSQAPSRKAHP
jgi:hypothetical protein